MELTVTHAVSHSDAVTCLLPRLYLASHDLGVHQCGLLCSGKRRENETPKHSARRQNYCESAIEKGKKKQPANNDENTVC